MGNSSSKTTVNQTTQSNVTNFYTSYHMEMLDDTSGSSVKCLRLGLRIQDKYHTDSAQLTDDAAKNELKDTLLRFAVVEAVKEQQPIGAIRHAFKLLNKRNQWEMDEKDFDKVIDDLITLREPATRLNNLEENLNVLCTSFAVYIQLFPSSDPVKSTTLVDLANALMAITTQLKTTKEKNEIATRTQTELNEWYNTTDVDAPVDQPTPVAQINDTP